MAKWVLGVGVAVMALCSMPSGVVAADPPKALKLVLKSNVLWERCWDERILGRRIEVCLKVTEEDSKFYLVVSYPSGEQKYELADREGDLEFGPFKIKYKVSEVEIVDGKLNSVRLKLEACVGGFCRTLFNDKIIFSYPRAATKDEPGVTYKYASDVEVKK